MTIRNVLQRIADYARGRLRFRRHTAGGELRQHDDTTMLPATICDDDLMQRVATLEVQVAKLGERLAVRDACLRQTQRSRGIPQGLQGQKERSEGTQLWEGVV